MKVQRDVEGRHERELHSRGELCVQEVTDDVRLKWPTLYDGFGVVMVTIDEMMALPAPATV